MAEVELYWKSLWGDKAQHNGRAEQIRREERRKICNMGWVPIQITAITSFLSKARNWKSPEVIKYKIIGLKHSQLTTAILQKTSI